MPETRRQYDPEFKAGAVRIVLETRRPVAEVVLPGPQRDPSADGGVLVAGL